MNYVLSNGTVDDDSWVDVMMIVLSVVVIAVLIFMYVYLRPFFFAYLPLWIVSFFVGWVLAKSD